MSEAKVSLLEGMQCPGCGFEAGDEGEHLHIEVTLVADVFPSGVSFEGSEEGARWEDQDYCQCCECGHEGTVGEFLAAGAAGEGAKDGSGTPA